MAALRIILLLLIVASWTAGAGSIAAAQSIPPTPIPAPIGIVLLHGKKGSPGYLAAARTTLISQGHLVSTPEMCWSDRRLYDCLYPDCLTEIDAAVAELRQRGAKSIVIAGHSLGGAAALAYGASHDGLAGIIGFAAGDAFWGPHSMLPDIARARNLVDQGKGDALGEFADIRIVGNSGMRTTAAHFLSFVAPPATQMMPESAARLRVPLLLVAGTRDMTTLQYGNRAYDRAPKNALNRFVQVEADHNGTLQAGMKPALDWLASLARGS